jgi:glycosyltransferase involved in cell wall biosynthesis
VHRTDKKIKVCFVAPKAYEIFNPDTGDYVGGAEVDLYYLATEIALDSNFEVSAVVADYGQKGIEAIEGVTIFRSLDFSKNVLDGLFRTWQALKRADADIYMMKCASPGVSLVSIFCKLHRRIFIYRLASLLESDGTYVRQHPILGKLFNWSLRHADAVLAQNVTDEENLARTTGIHSRAIPNGHRLPPLQQQPRDAILWVGRDHPIKNPDCLLDLAKAVPNERFIMICQTLDKDKHYADLIARAGKISNLQFIPHVPFNQIDEFFRRAKVLVNTSHSEGFPNAFIQASKCGTPILSFAVNPDGFLDKHGCGLCCNGDPALLISNLRFMLDGGRYVEFGSNARRYSEKYHDISRIAVEYKSIFARLAQNR